MESKYAIQYYSVSKKDHIAIETMPTPHILNAWRKVCGKIELPGPDDDMAKLASLRECFEHELNDRGCTYDDENDRWAIPQEGGFKL